MSAASDRAAHNRELRHALFDALQRVEALSKALAPAYKAAHARTSWGGQGALIKVPGRDALMFREVMNLCHSVSDVRERVRLLMLAEGVTLPEDSL